MGGFHYRRANLAEKSYSSWELRSSWLFSSEWWQSLTDVSGQPIGPLFQSQESKKRCPDGRGSHLLCGGSLKSRTALVLSFVLYRRADKSLAWPGRKQARNMSATRAISTTSRRELSSSFFLQGKAPKEIHAILTETLVCFLPGRANDLPAPLYVRSLMWTKHVACVEECVTAQVVKQHLCSKKLKKYVTWET